MLAGSGKNGGFALVVVILVMLLTSFMASNLIMKVRAELKITAKYRQRAIGRLLAEGGISLGLFMLKDQPNLDFDEFLDGATFLKGYPYETVLPNGKIKYYAVAESGKINLNSTKYGLIEDFLEYHGLEPDEVSVVVDSLQDWRDPGDEYRTNGAELDYYQELEKPYIPRNGKIEDPGEFFLIRGTEPLRGVFDPYEVFTTKGTYQININTLTPEMLDFLTSGQKELQEEYYEKLNLGNGRISKSTLQGIIGEKYASLQSYFADTSPSKTGLFSITAYGFEGDFSEVQETEEETEGTGETREGEEKTSYRPGAKVRVMVDINNRGKGIKYLSWKEQHV